MLNQNKLEQALCFNPKGNPNHLSSNMVLLGSLKQSLISSDFILAEVKDKEGEQTEK